MSNLHRILLVEDDRSIAGALALTLKGAYLLDIAATGKQAIYKTDTYNYDLVLLDLNLPDTSGIAICQMLRHRGVSAPILILSGQRDVLTKISLLDAGANDYITKPFSLGELKARIRVLTRHQNTPIWPVASLKVSGVSLDKNSCEVSRDNQVLRLRRKEFDILQCLMEHAGLVVSREKLIEYVWQESDNFWTNTLDVHIKYLRDKLDKPFNSSLIETVHGRGYKFKVVSLKEKV
jgi:two-component system OmpR family response regulator